MSYPPPETIELATLRLRRAHPDDADALFECASDAEVARYMDWPRPASATEVRRRIEDRQKRWESRKELQWVITPLDADRALGAIACHIAGHAAEVGYFIHREDWGRGLATAAARAVVDWALSTRAVRRAWATCDIDNTASARVLEKAGLTREGRLGRWAVRPNLAPEPRDAWLYARTR